MYDLKDTGIIEQDLGKRILTNGEFTLTQDGKFVTFPPLDLVPDSDAPEDGLSLNIDLGGDDPNAPIIHIWRKPTAEERAQRIADRDQAIKELTEQEALAAKREAAVAVVEAAAKDDPKFAALLTLLRG